MPCSSSGRRSGRTFPAAALLLALVVSALARGALARVSPPVGLAGAAVNSSAIRMSWQAAVTGPGTSVIRYRLYRNNGPLVDLDGSLLSYLDTGLAASTTYTYRARAVNSRNQQSALTARVRAATADAAPIQVAPCGTTALPIRTPSAISGFGPDATGVPFNWGFMKRGAYVQYRLSAPQGGDYRLTLLESSWLPGAGVKVLLDNVQVASIPFSSRGSWTNYVTSDPAVVSLPAGVVSTLRVQDATGVGFNLAGFSLTPASDGPGLSIGGRKGINTDIFRLGSDAAASAEASTIAGLGIAWARVAFPWSEMEHDGQGTVSTSGHDMAVKALAAKGINILGIICYTPPWANGGKDQMVPPDDPHVADFAKFATFLATRYGPMGVHSWEVWNEPNIQPFWATGADPVRYTALMKAACAAIKQADSAAVVITAGLAPAGSDGGNLTPMEFLSGIYAAGAKGSFDAVGMHPYTFPGMPNATDGSAYWWTKMDDLRAIMAANGDGDKKVWMTEYGAPTNGPPDSGKVTEAKQAAMLDAAYALNRAAGWAGPLFWYDLRDSGTEVGTIENFFGLVRPDGSYKPAYATMKAAPNT